MSPETQLLLVTPSMRFSFAFVSAIAVVLALCPLSGAAEAATATVIAATTTSDLHLGSSRRRRLDDSYYCDDQYKAYGACLEDHQEAYYSCPDCIEEADPYGGKGAYDSCEGLALSVCAAAEACPCVDPCLDEYSALYTCTNDIVFPGCTISCGGGGGGGGSSGVGTEGGEKSTSGGGGSSTGGGGGSGTGSAQGDSRAAEKSSGGVAEGQQRVTTLAPIATALMWSILAQ